MQDYRHEKTKTTPKSKAKRKPGEDMNQIAYWVMRETVPRSEGN